MSEISDVKEYQVVIVGAGAAGLMCAIEAAKRHGDHSVLLIDHAKSVGEKIRISGGGRCNFTNLHTSPANYISENPRFCISALKRYDQHDFIAMVESYNIKYHEKTLGQLFCDESSKLIINMLLEECKKYGVEILLNVKIDDLTKGENDVFALSASTSKSLAKKSRNDNSDKSDVGGTDIPRVIYAKHVVIATGGPSIPKMGATDWGQNIARKFGHEIIAMRPALVPFVMDSKTMETQVNLAGTAVKETLVSCNGKSFREAILFTHKGLSGPAILQISSYWKAGDIVTINLSPDINSLEEMKRVRSSSPKQEMHNILAGFLPKKLAQYISNQYGRNIKIGSLSNKSLEEVSNRIHNWQIVPEDTEGYRTAEVTAGGVNVNEISSKTFESQKFPGLFFIGEVLDVTGHLGGFNFQWAWSSGYAAGQYV